jgi:hypothetical protein
MTHGGATLQYSGMFTLTHIGYAISLNLLEADIVQLYRLCKVTAKIMFSKPSPKLAVRWYVTAKCSIRAKHSTRQADAANFPVNESSDFDSSNIMIAGCDQRADVAIVIDKSNVDIDQFNTMRNFVSTLIGILDVESGNVRISIIVFGERAEILVFLGRLLYHIVVDQKYYHSVFVCTPGIIVHLYQVFS